MEHYTLVRVLAANLRPGDRIKVGDLYPGQRVYRTRVVLDTPKRISNPEGTVAVEFRVANTTRRGRVGSDVDTLTVEPDHEYELA